MSLKANLENPFRSLFLFGSLSAVIGAFFWILFQGDFIPYFPKQAHAHVMFFSFLLSFICGFLMTALPKMTQTLTTQSWELVTILFLNSSVLIASSLNIFSILIWIEFAQILFLTFYLARRLLFSKALPFEGFLFIPFALFNFILGLLLHDGSAATSSTLFLFSGQAFILNFICGLGSRLIPAISRIQQAISADEKSKKQNYRVFFLFALILNSTFILEHSGFESFAFGLRGILLIYFAFSHFKIHHKPMTWSFNAIGLKVAILFLIAGYFGAALLPQQKIALLHLSYLGGFALITIMVATRICLAHNGMGLHLETSKTALFPPLFFIFLSALLRALSLNHLKSIFLPLASFSFIFGILLWYILLAHRKKI